MTYLCGMELGTVTVLLSLVEAIKAHGTRAIMMGLKACWTARVSWAYVCIHPQCVYPQWHGLLYFQRIFEQYWNTKKLPSQEKFLAFLNCY